MSDTPNVVIVLARCAHSAEPFGVRFEQQGRAWIADWAFALRESVARREGYEATRLDGSFGFAHAYPGCPYCESSGLVKCGCGRVACWNGRSRRVFCPWCGSSGTLHGAIRSLDAGSDR